jgi:EmrB/QacA subfamily drug resistance transporter
VFPVAYTGTVAAATIDKTKIRKSLPMGEPTSSARDAGTVHNRLRRIVGRLSSEPPPLAYFTRQPWHPWLIVALVSTGAFIGQLDATIVQLALPTLGKTFDASLGAVSWVALAYLVAFASFLPIFGRLCEMFGRKSLYLAGYALFIAASALCGLAPDLPWLIVFRVLQGIGGSLLGANSISILVKAVDQERQGRALGYFAAAQAIGMSAGPAVGGLVLGTLGWHWVFWISVPFGFAAFVIGWLVLPRTETLDKDKAFDWHGALLLGPALVFLVLVLNQISAWGPTSPMTIACAALAAALLWLLVRQERASSSPLVDLRLFRSAAFSGGVVAVVLGYALLYGIFFLMSFALEHGHGDSPEVAGFRLAVIPVALGIVAPFSSALGDRLGARLLSAMGMALCVIALLMLGIVEADPTANRLVGTAAFALFGAGLGVFIAPNNHATLKAAPASLSGEAGSMLNLMRVLGTSLGVASASSTLAWRLETVTGAHDSWIPFAGHRLLGAVESSLAMLAVMAIAAAAASLVRTSTRATP